MINSINTKIKSQNQIKKGIWLFFYLLIFEGALRKWVLPSFATPLLIIKDPLCVYLLYKTYSVDLLPKVNHIYIYYSLGIISFFTSILFGHENLNVAFFGLRIFVIYLPMIFIIGKIFTKRDVIRMGVVLLYISIPMTILLAIQFLSPQSSWVNRGVGGDVTGSGFDGALGYFRSSCTFSFTNGTSLFYGLLVCYILYFLFDKKNAEKFILFASVLCLVVAIPLSISRTLLYEVILTVATGIIVSLRSSKAVTKLITLILIISVSLTLATQLSFFSIATEAFAARFEGATANEKGIKGTIIDRAFGSFLRGFDNIDTIPFWGYGLGMGTNVGALLLKGKRDFLIAEEEWGRVMGEMGLLLGSLFLYWRLKLSWELLSNSFRHLNNGNTLPLLLSSFGLINIIQGQFAQPTALGFAVLTGGLIIASMKEN